MQSPMITSSVTPTRAVLASPPNSKATLIANTRSARPKNMKLTIWTQPQGPSDNSLMNILAAS